MAKAVIWEATTYNVLVTVTGANFDAVSYRGEMGLAPILARGRTQAERDAPESWMVEIDWRHFAPTKRGEWELS